MGSKRPRISPPLRADAGTCTRCRRVMFSHSPATAPAAGDQANQVNPDAAGGPSWRTPSRYDRYRWYDTPHRESWNRSGRRPGPRGHRPCRWPLPALRGHCRSPGHALRRYRLWAKILWAGALAGPVRWLQSLDRLQRCPTVARYARSLAAAAGMRVRELCRDGLQLPARRLWLRGSLRCVQQRRPAR